jgi:tetratricopeptide (TPR) repeat protein
MKRRIGFAALALALCAHVARAGDAALERALAALKQGDFAKVVASAREVPKDSADFAKAQYLAGEAQLVLGQPADAEQSFRAVLASNASSVPGHVGLGRALAGQDKLEEAEKELRAAVAADAKDARAHCALGEVLARRDRAKDARAELAEASKLAPKDPGVARSYVELLIRLDDKKDAAKVAKALTKACADHPMGPFLEALVLEREGSTDDAIRAYEAALKLDDAFLDAHKNLAILCHTMSATYSIQVRVDKALAHYERYFALGGKDPELQSAYEQMRSFLRPEKQGDDAKGKHK